MSAKSLKSIKNNHIIILSLILPVFLAVSCFYSNAFGSDDQTGSLNITVSQSPHKVPAGDALVVTLIPEGKADNVKGVCYENEVFFFKKSKDENIFYALIGTDVNQEESTTRLDFTIDFSSGVSMKYDFDINVKRVEYPEENLTLPQKMVEPPEEVTERIKREREEVLKIYNNSTFTPNFGSPFIIPLDTQISSSFGKRRVLNSIPKSPHSGIDLRGNIGTIVNASNNGTVVLAKELYFTGNTIIVDHGLGLYSAYFHLDDMYIGLDKYVKKGDKIGTVGITGRTTGPHLHFGIKLNGFYVNPVSIISLTERIFGEERKEANNVPTK